MKRNILTQVRLVALLFFAASFCFASTWSYAADESQLKDLPLDKAVRVGMGKNTVIEFTDPDCPFCRKLDAYMKQRKDVTRYIFLFPLTQLHPKSEEKAKLILCSKNPAGTLEEVMSGQYDKEMPTPCNDEKYVSLLKEFRETGQKLGINGTPSLYVNGNFISGANIPAIEQIIGPLRKGE